MSQGVVSKNLFDVLGNDPELDPDREPAPPTKAIDKPQARQGKRNAPAEAPVKDTGRGGRGGRHENVTGNELAFRDRNAGRDQNRSKPAEEGHRYDRHPHRLNDSEYRGRGRGRGGRGGRGGGGGGGYSRDDRHSKTGVADHEKQVAHGWGGIEGNAELADEKAGEAIAEAEAKEEGFTPDTAAQDESNAPEAAEPEPEDKTKSFAAWQAEQAEKRAGFDSGLNLRKANEGQGKKFPQGKAISREEEEEFISGTGGKQKRERVKKEKTLLELDDSKIYKEEERGSRGGRGRGRGGRGGEFRGERGERGERGGERGGDRGGRGGRPRGEYRGRGGRGGQPGPNVTDESAFPSLGS